MQRVLTFGSVLAAVALAACAATKQQVSTNLESRYLGQNVDVLVSEFGPPASGFRMNSGETAYVWQLSAVTSFNGDRYGGTARTHYCKVNVIASPAGIITQLKTEDASGTGGILGLAGVDVYGSICAQRLGIARQL